MILLFDNDAECEKFSARFWAKVDRSGGPEACWEFMGARGRDGYGVISVAGRLCGAHRVAWALTYGAIPRGVCVLHKCDHRPCCNPADLFLGTRADNSADMASKGRGGPINPVRGSKHPSAKLSESAVVEIKARLSRGDALSRIGADFGVAKSSVWAIANGVTWAHVQPAEAIA